VSQGTDLPRTNAAHGRDTSHRLTRPLVALGLGLLVAVAPISPKPAGTSARYTATGLSTGQRELIDWAMGLFDQAALPLPPIQFVHHDTSEACLGSTGAQTYRDGRSTIHICTDDASAVEQFLFLHEIAHAWDRLALTDERRAAFLKLRGLTEWRNDDPERWHERGAEHAAEIMVWGLMDRPIRPVFIPHHSCGELLAGYLVLVGRPPLHGYTNYC
jgi:hypothetical protein